MVDGPWREATRELSFSGCRVSVLPNENVLGIGCTTV